MQTVNDWLFAVGTAAVPILTFVTVMYLLIKLNYLESEIRKIEAMQQQQSRDLIEQGKTIAGLQALLHGRTAPSNLASVRDC